jgi:hypothetical protein
LNPEKVITLVFRRYLAWNDERGDRGDDGKSERRDGKNVRE